MRIIRELEPGPRRLYTGGIGYFSPGGEVQFSVAIRTAIIDRKNGVAEYGAGGGIVIDSDADEEYAEALLKARIFTEPPPEFDLLETLRLTPETGYFLLDYHLRRLRDSAAYFDIPFDEGRLRRRLEEKARESGDTPQRLRLLLKRDGTETIESAPLAIAETAPRISVKLAAKPVDSSSPFLYHKTTRRDVYEQARAACPGCDDVLLWNERGELTETTIANVVVELDGRRLTPPVESGLLPGTFRQWLLDCGEIAERTIRLEDLPRATRLWRVNSVRGWQELKARL
jgi:para-aminobenzoate synthetase/4-amino-4-deoxychorismate lyase